MDFSFTEEQTLLEDSVARYIQNDYDFEARQQLLKTEDGFSRENWSTFAELGWLGVPFSEADGGFDGGAIEAMLQGKVLQVDKADRTVERAFEHGQTGQTAIAEDRH